MSQVDQEFMNVIDGQIVDQRREYTIKYLWSWDANIKYGSLFVHSCLFLIKSGLVLSLQGDFLEWLYEHSYWVPL